MAKRKNQLDSNLSATGAAPDAYVQMAFHLPKFYLRVLDGEAAYLGGQRRSQVLELLVLRKAGLIRAERSSSAPKYQVGRGELDDLVRYIWHCRHEIKEHLDRLRERMGRLPPRAWVMLALNEWIGLPAGMADLVDEAPTQPNERTTHDAPKRPRRGRQPAK